VTAAARDPSRSSWYVDDAFYGDLVERFAGFAREDRAVTDPAVIEACRTLLAREARLLDEGRFEDWLALYVPECLYWVPGTPGGDPRREIAFAFDDRRQLEGRIYRLRTGHAWSQIPASRTTRLIANAEVFSTPGTEALMVRSTFLISEFRAGESRVLSGWSAHRLERRQDEWRIAVKQVNLIDCDRNLRNPSLLL
jgi:3-phenylpropionate/cinnamic acid dioxygenase small subunit